jgi:hypothetical protein
MTPEEGASIGACACHLVLLALATLDMIFGATHIAPLLSIE